MSIPLFLDTQCWQNISGNPDGKNKLGKSSRRDESSTCEHCIPFEILQKQKVPLNSILDEIEEVVDYARTHLRLGHDKYSKAWYQLHTAPDSANAEYFANK